MDDMVSISKRGRPDHKCAKCPKYERSKLWCPIRAEARQPVSPACHYGLVLMGAERQEEHRDAKTSS